MEIKCLGSSSSGNSYAVDDGKSVLLLEAGIRSNEMLHGYYNILDRVAGCLITHEHTDHSKAMVDVHNYGIDIFASKGTFKGIKNVDITNYGYNIIVPYKQYKIGSFIVLPWQAQHDCNEPLGYLIYSIITNEKLLFATDTYYIPNKFVKLNYIMVECNYSEQILKKNIEIGLINNTLAKRLRQSHFSLENVKEFLKANDLRNCKEIFLLHLSDRNSDSNYFKTEIQKLTGKPVTVF